MEVKRTSSLRIILSRSSGPAKSRNFVRVCVKQISASKSSREKAAAMRTRQLRGLLATSSDSGHGSHGRSFERIFEGKNPKNLADSDLFNSWHS
ncbi:unnamed protein product, partial [Nesidiocoris tenuis]